MNAIILVGILVLIGWITYKQVTEYRRMILYNQLDSAYGKIELYIASNRMVLTNELKSFFAAYKNLIVNPEFADIQVRLSIMLYYHQSGESLENVLKETKKTRQEFPDELNRLLDEFNAIHHKMVLLSLYKPSFIWFILAMAFESLMRTKIKLSGFKRLYTRFDQTLRSDVFETPGDVRFA